MTFDICYNNILNTTFSTWKNSNPLVASLDKEGLELTQTLVTKAVEKSLGNASSLTSFKNSFNKTLCSFQPSAPSCPSGVPEGLFYQFLNGKKFLEKVLASCPQKSITCSISEYLESIATPLEFCPAIDPNLESTPSLVGRVLDVVSQPRVLVGVGVVASLIAGGIAYKAFSKPSEVTIDKPATVETAAIPAQEPLKGRVQTILSNFASKISQIFARLLQIFATLFRRF